MPTQWDIAAERKLLITIIELVGLKPPAWGDVAAAMGGTVTGEACRQHFNKIRKAERESSTGTANGNPATPVKRARASTKAAGSGTKSNSASASKKRKITTPRAQKASTTNGDDEDYEPEETPSKVKSDPDANIQNGIFFKIEKINVDDDSSILGNGAREGVAGKPIDLEADNDLYD